MVLPVAKDRFGFGTITPDRWNKGEIPEWNENPNVGFFDPSVVETKTELAQNLLDNFILEVDKGYKPSQEELEQFQNTVKMLEETMQTGMGHYIKDLNKAYGTE